MQGATEQAGQIGGLLVALAEMAMASGIGCEVDIGDAGAAFGEDQARYVVTGPAAEAIAAAGVPVTRIGTTGGPSVTGPGFDMPVKQLREANERFFKEWMGDGLDASDLSGN